jgi:hypothetical protein
MHAITRPARLHRYAAALLAALLAGLMGTAPAEAQFQKCGWFGTAPLCAGRCPAGWTSLQRSGAGCVSGSKVWCCEVGAGSRKSDRTGKLGTPITCEWFGTAPFCAGRCPAGWTLKGRSGAGCATGSKVRCCDFNEYCRRNGRVVRC